MLLEKTWIWEESLRTEEGCLSLRQGRSCSQVKLKWIGHDTNAFFVLSTLWEQGSLREISLCSRLSMKTIRKQQFLMRLVLWTESPGTVKGPWWEPGCGACSYFPITHSLQFRCGVWGPTRQSKGMFRMWDSWNCQRQSNSPFPLGPEIARHTWLSL